MSSKCAVLKKIQMVHLFLFFCFLTAKPCSIMAGDLSLSNKRENWTAQGYTANSKTQQDHATVVLERMHLRGNEKILDLGSRDGRITAELAKKVPQGEAIGLEPSQSMLNTANQLKNQLGLKNLNFLEGRADTFSLHKQFDVITAIHEMHWIKDQKQALDNIYRHLNPQGKIYFVIAPSKEGLSFDIALKKTLKKWHQDFLKFENNQYAYDMDIYHKLLKSSGFHVDQIVYTYYQKDYTNKNQLSNWVKQWLPHYKFLPNEKREQFLEDLVNAYLAEIDAKNQKGIYWGEYVLYIEATKIS